MTSQGSQSHHWGTRALVLWFLGAVGFILTLGLNPGLPHGRQILYQLSHRGSPRTLEWVASLFPRGIVCIVTALLGTVRHQSLTTPSANAY